MNATVPSIAVAIISAGLMSAAFSASPAALNSAISEKVVL